MILYKHLTCMQSGERQDKKYVEFLLSFVNAHMIHLQPWSGADLQWDWQPRCFGTGKGFQELPLLCKDTNWWYSCTSPCWYNVLVSNVSHWGFGKAIGSCPQAGNTGVAFLMGSAPPHELMCPLAPIHVKSKFLPMLTLVIDATFDPRVK